jgi:hypothetical protein
MKGLLEKTPVPLGNEKLNEINEILEDARSRV